MRRVLILPSNPHHGGNPDTLCDEFLCGAIKAGNNAEKIFLRDKTIHYCTGCSMCSLYGRSYPQKDGTTGVIGKMLVADVIVMSTPAYFYTMSVQMKTLIDRCYSQYTKIADKEFYSIVTAAEDDQKEMLCTTNTFQGFLDCLENPTVKGMVYGLGVWHTGEIRGNPAVQGAYEMGKSI